MAQAMGTSNVLWWFNPFAGSPKVGKDGAGSGWTWEENGFNRKEGMWPPPDPEKIRRAARAWGATRRDYAAELEELDQSPEQQKEAFRRRQEADLRRKRKMVAELEEVDDYESMSEGDEDPDNHTHPAGPGWANPDGERLCDYGVEEDTDDAADDDVPLAEIIRRRKTLHKDNYDM